MVLLVRWLVRLMAQLVSPERASAAGRRKGRALASVVVLVMVVVVVVKASSISTRTVWWSRLGATR